MSQPRYDVIVLGLGAMGSAALYQLAKRGAHVLGIDQFAPPHIHGSTHGETRITRLAIGEGAHYTPLVRRSHEIWREIERETGAELLTQCGGLIISSDKSTAINHVPGFFRNTVDAANEYGIGHEILDAAAIRARFPMFKAQDGDKGYYEPSAGFLRPERCVGAELDLAVRHGAVVQFGETAQGFEETALGIVLATDKGRYEADRLILTAGPWLPQLIDPNVENLFRVYRQVQFWFETDAEHAAFEPGAFPVFIWEPQGAAQSIYGFPALDALGMKIGREQKIETTTPQGCRREVTPDEPAALYRDYVAPNFRGVSARCSRSATCLYTVTPDAGFVIDALPGTSRVILTSACSGHGFKHSPAIGEALAELALEGRSRHDLSPFGLARFAS